MVVQIFSPVLCPLLMLHHTCVAASRSNLWEPIQGASRPVATLSMGIFRAEDIPQSKWQTGKRSIWCCAMCVYSRIQNIAIWLFSIIYLCTYMAPTAPCRSQCLPTPFNVIYKYFILIGSSFFPLPPLSPPTPPSHHHSVTIPKSFPNHPSPPLYYHNTCFSPYSAMSLAIPSPFSCIPLPPCSGPSCCSGSEQHVLSWLRGPRREAGRSLCHCQCLWPPVQNWDRKEQQIPRVEWATQLSSESMNTSSLAHCTFTTFTSRCCRMCIECSVYVCMSVYNNAIASLVDWTLPLIELHSFVQGWQ